MTMYFEGYECEIVIGTYPNGNTRIDLVDAEDRMPVATATICVSEKLNHDIVVIKDFSENTGMADALEEAGMLGDFLTQLPTGQVSSPVYELSELALQLMEEAA